MNYFFKTNTKIPYTVVILFFLVMWSLLCAGLGFFLILSRADFSITGTKDIFIFTFLTSFFLVGEIPSIIEYGALEFLGIKAQRKDFRILNSNIKGGHISPDISTEALKEVFYSLVNCPASTLKISLRSGGLIIFLVFFAEYLVSEGLLTNFPIIIISGIIALFLLSLFSVFFVQYFVSFSLKETRQILAKRNTIVKEPQFKFSNLETELNLSHTLPIFISLIIYFLFGLDLIIMIFITVSLLMAASISRVLAFSISQTFREIEDFTNALPLERRAMFSTGSLIPTIIDLSTDLNEAAEEIYNSREKVEQSRKELKKRAEELEKWRKLIIGRETKIKELIKEKKLLEKNKKCLKKIF